MQTFLLTICPFTGYTLAQNCLANFYRGEFYYEKSKNHHLPDGRYCGDGRRAVRARPADRPIGAIPISLANFVICLTAWLLGPKFGTLSVVIYLAIGLIGVPVFSGYGAGLAKVAGPTGGYLVGYLLLAFIGGLFIEKSNGQPVVSAVGLVLGDAACYVLGTAWFVFQMQCDLGYALTVCVYPFIVLDLAKIVVSCIVGALLRKRLVQAGVLHLKEA